MFRGFGSYTARLPFGSTKTRKVATKIISYRRYGGILFQKVASGYLLHFVQDGSSKNALEKTLLRKNIKDPKIGEQIPINPPSLPLKGTICPLEGPQNSRSTDPAAAMLYTQSFSNQFIPEITCREGVTLP